MAALDAGVPLRDVQLAARHADPRTTTIYDRRRENFDRHAAYVVVAFVAGGHRPSSHFGDTAGGCGGAFRAEVLGLLVGVAAVESIGFGGPSEFLAEAARTLAAERAATLDVAGIAG